MVLENPDGECTYKYTNNWFNSTAKNIWESLFSSFKPKKILEIGSYEGASTCYLIKKLALDTPLEIHCVDTWQGGIEHRDRGIDMAAVESRFIHNTALARSEVPYAVTLTVHKGYSYYSLSTLIANNQGHSFDLAYIDGSHQASDVLADAVLAFKLLKVGGIMIFDDYLWAEELSFGKDLLRCPKLAIDSFINCYFRKVKVISAPLYQLYVRKIEE